MNRTINSNYLFSLTPQIEKQRMDLVCWGQCTAHQSQSWTADCRFLDLGRVNLWSSSVDNRGRNVTLFYAPIMEQKEPCCQRRCWETEYSNAKIWNWALNSHHIQKLIQKWINDLNIRTKTRKLLEVNTGGKSSWSQIWKWILDMTLKTQAMKRK